MRQCLPSIALLVVLASGVTPSGAQARRPGIRLSLTRVEPMGGFTASGFLVVPASRIVRTPAPECGDGATRIEAAGRDAHGRIRGVHLVVIATDHERELPFGPGSCEGSLVIELDDGTTLSPDRGAVRIARVGTGGIDATVSASVTGPTGVPTTITGQVTLPSG